MNALAKEAEVISVDPTSGLVNVRFLYGDHKEIHDVRVLNMSERALGTRVPEIGSACYVARSSDSAMEWVVLGSVMDKGSTQADLNQGDVGWSTPQGNKLILRRNGDVELFSGETNKIYMWNLEDLMEIRTSKWHVITEQGTLLWEPFTMQLNLGAEGDTDSIVLKLGDAGSTYGTDDWAGSKDVRSAIKVGSTFHAEIAEDGSYSFEAKETGVSILENFWMRVGGPSDVKTKDMDVTGDSYDFKIQDLRVEAAIKLRFEAPLIEFEGDLIKFNEADGPAIDGFKFLQWLSSVQVVNGMVSPASIMSFAANCLNFKIWL